MDTPKEVCLFEALFNWANAYVFLFFGGGSPFPLVRGCSHHLSNRPLNLLHSRVLIMALLLLSCVCFLLLLFEALNYPLCPWLILGGVLVLSMLFISPLL